MTGAAHTPGEARPARVSRSDRAEQLLDVALELIAERGHESVSVSAIAEAAGITKPIIYRIYPSRHALLLALYRREQRRIDAALDLIVPGDPGDRLPLDVIVDGLEGILEAATEHPLSWRLALFSSEGTPAPLRTVVRRRRAGLVKRAEALVKWGIPYLATDQPPDADILARMLVSWAEEHARMLLDDDSLTAEHLIASTRALLEAVAWREAPAPRPGDGR